jgi:hypothetical protein
MLRANGRIDQLLSETALGQCHAKFWNLIADLEVYVLSKIAGRKIKSEGLTVLFRTNCV